ncbi:aspartic peptidase domain-containing protein [Pilaira anomala]|nr:aspartic peptidase domain-containing protein [Pilaira anomala]
MKSIVFLISTAITLTLAEKLITVPFTASERVGNGITSSGSKKLADLIDVPLKNIDLAYLIDIEIGTPPQPFTLLLDTGSSSTWVPVYGCGRYCGYPFNSLKPANSSTFSTDHMLFSIRYGEGFSRGYYAKDTVRVNGVSVPNVNFAVSDYNDGELTADGADGILGIGPDQLSIYNNPDKKVVPTLITSMFQQKIIDRNMFSVYFQPLMPMTGVEQKRINGEIVFGGVRARHIASDVRFIPTTKKPDFVNYWAIDIQSITVGNYSKKYDTGIAAMVDTGSTLVFLPRDIISNVFKNVKGIRKDYSGQYIVPCRSDALPNIDIKINNYTYTMTPENYVITSGALSYSTESCYTYIQESPPFVDAILGYGFLQQYVSVYDNENSRIGFAQRA